MTKLQTSSTSIEPAPISWVESLFSRMVACYGSKFADMWRDADMKMVKSMWASEMGKLTHEELRHGFQSLMSRAWPPTLPEYIILCKSLEKRPAAHVMALPAPKSDLSSEKAAEMLDSLSVVFKTKDDPLLWARKIIERSKQKKHGLSMHQIKSAKEALSAE